MRRAVVTGGAGFIGSHVVDRLISLDWEVLVIDNLSTGRREFLNPEAKFLERDIRDKTLEKIIIDFNPSVIFHLAAQIDVRKAMQNPEVDADVNILGTINLIKISRNIADVKIIFSSTGGAIYGEGEFIDENRVPEPISPYGVSKLACEGYLRSLSQNVFRYTNLRYGNVYGPRQNPLGEAGVVAIFIGNLLNNRKSILYGYGNMVRDYVYVDDVVDANILAVEKGDGETLNIGTGKPATVDEIYKILQEYLSTYIFPDKKDKRDGEIYKVYLNSDRAFHSIGWKAKTFLEDGLKKTVEWFEKKGISIWH